MGSGIAQVAAVAGHDVVLRDVTEEALARGRAASRSRWTRFVDQGHARAGRRPRPPSAGSPPRPTWTRPATADVVVEAVFESLEVKHEVFRELDRICRGRCGAGDQHQRHPDHPHRRGDRAARRRWSARTSSRRCR